MDGASLGFAVDGFMDGSVDGFDVGVSDGVSDRSMDGSTEGTKLGSIDGTDVGFKDGSTDSEGSMDMLKYRIALAVTGRRGPVSSHPSAKNTVSPLKIV